MSATPNTGAPHAGADPVQRLLERLEGVTSSREGHWQARCPAHDDARPSLAVSRGRDGKVLVKCHAGCKTVDMVRAVGLELRDLFPANAARARRASGGNGTPRSVYRNPGRAITALEKHRGAHAAQWVYQNRDGLAVGIVVRWNLPDGKKEVRPISRGADGWRIEHMPAPRPLYRLPTLLQDQGTVYVAEGEKCADAAAAIGLLSTTSAGGAEAEHKTDWSTLKGRDVVILPDHDQPGRGYADAVAGILRKLDPPAIVRIVPLPGLEHKEDCFDFIKRHRAWGKDDALIRQLIEQLAADAPPWEPSAPEPATSKAAYGGGSASIDGRPAILITTEEHLVNDQAVSALSKDGQVYQRGGLLVRVVRDHSPATKDIRRPFAPRIDSLPPPLLRERLAANARWEIEKQTKDGPLTLAARPPAWCVAAVHARADWPAVRHLEAVVDYPVLRPDGSILCCAGFDPATGLLLEPLRSGTGDHVLPIPEAPSLADAQAAVADLLQVVADFPFEADAHRAAWLAGLLTPLARFAFHGPAPLFLVDANVRGAGKGLLLDSISRIVTGERFTIATYTSDEDELRKRITSLALAGDRLVLFDNLEGRFGNAVLDAALTGTAWKDRVLGVNRMTEAPLYMTWYATGNNVSIATDTARRVCHVRLESPEERPEQRQDFQHPNLLAWIGEHRQHLLRAALTVLRGYFAAGKPDLHLPAWGSFEGWSRIVRSAVVWAGLPDPAATKIRLQEQSDVTAEAMVVLLEGWERPDPNRQGLTAAEVISRVKGATEDKAQYLADLQDAIEALVGRLDARLLGYKLRSQRRRIIGGRFLDRAGSAHKTIRWAVWPAAEFSACRKTSPPSPPSPPPPAPDRAETGGDGGDGGDNPARAEKLGDWWDADT